MHQSRGMVRTVSSVVVLGLLALAAGCGDKSANQTNEGAVCDKGEKGCSKNVMKICNTSQTGYKEYECASADSCLKGLPYNMCAEDVGDAGVAECTEPMANCNSNMSDGCETNLGTSVKHCGACGNECASTNGAPRCVAGQCQIDCAADFSNCDGNAANGCETSLSSDPNNCGGCSNRCSDINGISSCVAGKCAVTSCTTGYGDCNSKPLDGCEAVLLTDPNNCGACGQICANAHGTTSCVSGICSPTCAPGYGDCDGNPINGCEADTRSNANHCGVCGRQCEGGTRAVCIAGICDLACEAGKGDCDRESSNGCEADTTANPLNCGVCGRACTNAHGTTACAAGTCVPTCATGFADCDGNAANGCEAAIDTSLENCGGCGKVCSGANGTAVCSSGICSITCAANYADCDASVANGCESYLPGDPKHCGACAKVCTATGGTPTCSLGVCGLTCDAQHADCDTLPANGCEVATATDKDNCGGCGKVCGGANALATCEAGACKLTCDVGYRDCNTNGADGCEAALASDPKNCGRCGHSCGSGTCKEGLCQPWVVTMGYARPTRLQVTSESIFWINEGISTNDGSVMRLDHGATTPVALASAQAKPADIAVTDTVFWTNSGDGTVKQVAKTGGAPFTLAQNVAQSSPICATVDWVLWNSGYGKVKYALSTNATEELGSSGTDLDCRAGIAYSANGTNVERIDIASGSSSSFYSHQFRAGVPTLAGRIVALEKSVCWHVFETYNTGICCSDLSEVTLAYRGTGSLTGGVAFSVIAADENYLYWASASTLSRGPMTPGASELVGSVSSPADLAVHGGAVYWTEPGNGRIMAIATP